MNLNNKVTNVIASILLGLMFTTAFFSMKGDSLTFDELAHVSAGYSYLTQQDYRLNPEHPPLAKDITAFPLLFLNLNFPSDEQVWLQEDSAPAWWVQFDLGREFLYNSDNNPQQIIFWSRLAAIIMLIFFGWLIFQWTRKTTNNVVALTTLTFFAFSPTFLAHGRLTNTDVGAVLGMFLAVTCWLKFLKQPTWKNILLAGLVFGLAMLFKFSLILLIPFFVIITLLYAFLFSKPILPYLTKSLLVGLTGFILVIWPIYQLHVLNYPAEQQLRDTIADISGHPIPAAKDMVIWMTKQEPLRAPAQYLRGVLMASQRTAWGNTTFFNGQISASSWKTYFPSLYLFKIPLSFHLLSLLALGFSLLWLKRNNKKEIINSIRHNFWLIALLIWIIFYWLISIAGNLNIGIRHLLPVFPFTYILVSFGLYQIIKAITKEKIQQTFILSVFLLLILYAASSLTTFPHYLSYYNELAGGTVNGYKTAVDSNYDWGQDFYRLLAFIEKENIDKIHLDYFGGEDPEYWLKEKYVKLNPKEIKEPPKGWLAVSVNQLMGGLAEPAPGFDQETGYYNWLRNYSPVAKAGHSIFIYKIE
jgi:hypothetical protein